MGLIAGNSIKCHEKSILGKPFCVAPNTCTSYCPPGLRPNKKYTPINNSYHTHHSKFVII